MVKAKLIAIVTGKLNSEVSTWQVVKLKYDSKDNTLWITDNRGHLMDFDLNEYNVEIKSIKEIMT